MGSPFDSGKTLVFKSMCTAGPNRYLNSAPSKKSVYLQDSVDFSCYPGCHWESIKQDDGSYRLKSVSTSSDSRYLDSMSALPSNQSVYLKDASAGGGSYWTPTRLCDGSYSLHSQTPSGPKRFMSANTEFHGVYLEENSDPIGTHWMVGVDYYSGEEVERIINSVYPGIAVNFYQADANYGSLDYNLLCGIWNDSKLGGYQWKAHKFDYNDFAICMKAEASTYSYNQKLPPDKGSLCGILWGKKVREVHAFNFTIDPFGNLILFEPQTGQEIDHNEYTPYFCMV